MSEEDGFAMGIPSRRTGVRVGRRAVKSVANRSATNGRQENPRQDAPTSTFRVQSAGLRQAPAHRRPSAGTEARSERRRVQPPFFNGSFSVPFGPIARGSPTAADSTTPNPVAEAARTPLPKSPPSASQAAPNNGAPSPGDRDGDPAATPGAGSPGGQPLQFSFGGLSPSSPFSFGSPENTRDGGIGGSGRGQGGAPTAPAPGIPFASPASGGVTRQDPSQSDRWQASAGGMAGAAGGAEGGGFAAGGGSPGAPSGPFAQSGLGGILFRNEVSHAKSQDVQGGFGSRTGGDGMDEEDRSAAGQSGRNGDSGDGVAWGAGTAGEQGMGDNKGWNGGGFAAPREGGARERAERVREAAPRGAGPWATGFSVGAGKKPVSGRMRTSGRGRGGLRSAPKGRLRPAGPTAQPSTARDGGASAGMAQPVPGDTKAGFHQERPSILFRNTQKAGGEAAAGLGRSSPEPAVARGASPEPPVPGTWFPATSAASGAPSMVSVDEQTPPADTADSVAAARGGPSGQWEAPRAATSVLGMPNPFGAGMAGGSGQGAQNASDQAEPPQPRPPEAWAKPSSWHMPPQGSIFGSPVWEAPGAHAVPQKGASGAQTTKEPGAGGGSWNAGPWFRGVGAGPAEDTGQARRPGAEAAGTHPDAMPNYTGSIGGSGRVFAAPSSEEASEASVRAREESIFGDIQNTTESFQVKLNLGDRVRWRKGGSKRRGPGRSKSAAAGSRQEPPAPSDAASTGLEMPEWMELGAQWHKAVSARDCAFQSYKAEDYEAAEQWYSYAVDAMAALARDSRLESAARADIATVPGWSGVTPPPCAEEVSLHLSRTLSNRSAARLMRGRPWEALLDAMDALQVDEKNVRARVRVGTCFLRVGLMGRAREVLEECMSVQAGDGAAAKAKEEAEQRLRELGKAQALVEEGSEMLLRYTKRGGPLADEGRAALEASVRHLKRALDILIFAEAPRAIMCGALMRLGRPGEAREVAGEGPAAPVMRDGSGEAASREGGDGGVGETSARLDRAAQWWRRSVGAACMAVEGDLEGSLDALGVMAGAMGAGWEEPRGADVGLDEGAWGVVAMSGEEVRERLFKAKKWAEAIKAYTDALAGPHLGGCPAAAAVLHSNRAACHQAAGSTLEALADACRAHALDPRFPKALSRLGSLLMEIRRASDAVSHLKALQDLPGDHRADIQKRIIEAERAVEAERPQDHFKLLGLKETCSDGDVRSAYKKAALLLHPDRALSKCGGRVGDARGMQCLAKWVAAGWEERARELSDWLFKCLGEAHECLMDASARASFERKHRDARGDDYTRPRPQRRYDHYGGSGFDDFMYRSGFGSFGRRGASRYYHYGY